MMVSFRGILKYLIYLFIAGWMFLLGIVVGRGTSPVKFDTKKFQDRLEAIAREHGRENSQTDKKMDLEFFGALNHPIPTEGISTQRKTDEIIPKKEDQAAAVEAGIPVKTGLKQTTYKKQDFRSDSSLLKKPAMSPGKETQVQNPATVKTVPPPKNETAKPVEASAKPAVENGQYTIQIAAYKDFKDAVTQMAQLEKKGFDSYREKSIIKGETWYRVRTGTFSTYAQAKLFNEKLKKAHIKALIIKKGQS